MRETCTTPTIPRKKLTAARLNEPVSTDSGQARDRIGHVQVVLGLDDQAPAGPDDTGGRQGGVLGEGELLGGTGKVGDTGEDESPLYQSQSASSTIIMCPYHPSTMRADSSSDIAGGRHRKGCNTAFAGSSTQRGGGISYLHNRSPAPSHISISSQPQFVPAEGELTRSAPSSGRRGCPTCA